MAAPVGRRLATQGVGHGFALQAARVPELFKGRLAGSGFAVLGAVAGGVHPRHAGLQQLIHQDAPVGGQAAGPGQRQVGLHAGGNAHPLAGDFFPGSGAHGPHPSVPITEDLAHFRIPAQVEVVKGNLALHQGGFFRGQHQLPVAALAHEQRDVDAPRVQHLGQFDANQPAAHHHRPLDALRVAGHCFEVR